MATTTSEQIEATEPVPPQSARAWPNYRTLWRWHFYASLFCMPFIVVLAISGSIYLFKPQIEAWSDRPYDHLEIRGSTATAAQQIEAALAAVPGATFNAYELPQTPQSAARVLVRQNGEPIRVYVHPETLQVLNTVHEDDRFTRFLFRLHGELLMGDRGSMLVELAASWTIILIITGLCLWWPRQAKTLGGVVYPRLNAGSRIFWRDLHAVTGVWVSGLALFLLLSGLPWAKSWGNYLKAARRLTGTAVAQQDWTNGSESRKQQSGAGEHGGHGHHRHSSDPTDSTRRATIPDLSSVNRLAAAAAPLDLTPPVLISPPRKENGDWTVKSMSANRPLRVTLVMNPTTAEIISREDFGDRHLIDRIVAIGIAAHEGQLFGWPNQALGLLTATGLVVLCASGTLMWWRRRNEGLGAPQATPSPRVPLGFLALVVLLGIYLPLFGTSLVAVLVSEKLVLSRLPGLRKWLGLASPEKTSAC